MNSKKLKKQRKHKKKMPEKLRADGVRMKYDWDALEEGFFASKYYEAKAYMEATIGEWNGHISRKCLGWGERKKKERREDAQLFLQGLKAGREEKVVKLLDKIFYLIEREIDRMISEGVEDGESLKRLWEIARTEAGLPKSISHNINDNTNIDLASARDSLLDKVNKATPKKSS